MDWTGLIKSEMEAAYNATEGLMDLVDADKLDWKPEAGENWMSTSELLRHLTSSCGWCSGHFVNDTWAEVMQGDGSDAPPSTVESVAEAKAVLAKDRELAFELLAKAGDESLGGTQIAAPWDPTERPLGQQLLQMVAHLNQHKAQLFYYLKMQGKPVNTFTMWGLPEPAEPAAS